MTTHHHHSDHGGIFYHLPDMCEEVLKVMTQLESDMHEVACSDEQCEYDRV